jgi:hypothetical protein
MNTLFISAVNEDHGQRVMQDRMQSTDCSVNSFATTVHVAR